MLTEWIYKISIYLFAGLACYAAVSDFRYFRIPNIVSIALLALWPVYLLTKPDMAGWTISLTWAAIFLVLGFFAFSKGYVGAGDVKFMATTTLWVPPHLFGQFLIAIGLSGGLLCFVLLTIRLINKNKPQAVTGATQTPPIQQKSPFLQQYAPYGVAIACGCLVTAMELLVNPNPVG